MTMKYLPLVGTHMEAQIQTNFLTYLAWSVNYKQKSRKSRFWEMKLLDMLTSRNFEGLSILTSELIPENLDRYLKDWLFYRTICKMAPNAGL